MLSHLQTAVIIVTFIFEVFGLLATASRMTWAFAREDGLPFSSYLARVSPLLIQHETRRLIVP